MLEIVLQYVIPAIIAGLFGWAALASGKRREQKRVEAATKAAAEAARINEQFPGWAELVTENRQLRTEITDLTTSNGSLRSELAEVRDAVDELRRGANRKIAAVTRVLRQIAAQWPTAHGPDIDPADLAELEDTEVIPPEWIRRGAKETSP